MTGWTWRASMVRMREITRIHLTEAPTLPETAPETITPTEPEVDSRTQILPPYAVILHNDDVNDMAHVVKALRRSVPGLTIERAAEIMFEAHQSGRARVVVCPLELAELYRDRLQSYSLTATIEKA